MTEEYNLHYGGKYCKRDEVGLRNCWANLKRKGRIYRNQERLHTLATGRGGKMFKRDEVMEELFKVLGRNLNPYPCLWDDDAPERPALKQLRNLENADPDLEIFTHLQKDGSIMDWSRNNPKKMKKEVSGPLRENMQRVRQSVSQVRQVVEKSNEEDDEPKGGTTKDVIVDDEKRKCEIEVLRANLKKTELEHQLIEVDLEMGLLELDSLQKKHKKLELTSSEEDL